MTRDRWNPPSINSLISLDVRDNSNTKSRLWLTYLSESSDRRKAPASPTNATKARTPNPIEKLPILSRIIPKRTGDTIEPMLLSVLNTPNVIPAAETPCLEAYGIREKSVAKYRFAPKPIPKTNTMDASSDLEIPNSRVKRKSSTIETPMVFLLPSRRSEMPPQYDPIIVATPIKATIPPAVEFETLNVEMR